MLIKSKFLIFAFIFCFSGFANAAMSPLSVNIVPPLQFPSEDTSVTGLRLSALWGQHRDLYGIDLGLLGNITNQTFVGVGISGGFNATNGPTTILGLQAALGVNLNNNKTSVYGIQVAAVNYNKTTSSVVGLDIAVANLTAHTTVYGLQAGIYNSALNVYGFQIGLINVTENLHGIQIGLLNFHSKGLFRVSPILNAGF